MEPSNLLSQFEASSENRDDQQPQRQSYMSSISRAPILIPPKSPAAPSKQPTSSPPPSSTHEPFSMASLIHASEAAAAALSSPNQKSSSGGELLSSTSIKRPRSLSQSTEGSSGFDRGTSQISHQQWLGNRGGAGVQTRFNVFDMKSLAAALASVDAGRGDVRKVLQSANQGSFRPRLPGLTKLVSQLTREGQWLKGLEIFESLDAIEGLVPDTTITNAAISACDKGGQWCKALEIFNAMDQWGMARDTITYSALISALAKGRNWELSIDVFNHMIESGIETDAVTCCSLITSLDKGGQWKLAEKVFVQMYADNPELATLLSCIEDDQMTDNSMPPSLLQTPMGSPAPQSMVGTPVQTQQAAVEAINNFIQSPNPSHLLGATVDRLSHLYPEGLDKMPETLTQHLCGLLGDTSGVVVFRDPPRSPPDTAALFSPLTPPSTPPMATSRLGTSSVQRSLLRASSLNVKKAAPNRVCCNALLAAYSRATPTQVRKAITLLESMWAIGGELAPDLVSYNTVIKAAGNARQIGTAFKVWKIMQDRGCESSQATFGTLISIAAEANEMDRVRNAWASLRTSGHEIHISSANAQLLACFAEKGSWGEGQKLFKDILSGAIGVKPNSGTFAIVMKACLERDMSDQVQILFRQMREMGVLPSSSIYGMLIEAYALRGQFKDATDVLARIFNDVSSRPPLSTFVSIFQSIGSFAMANKGNVTSLNELRITTSNVRGFLRRISQPQGQFQQGSPGSSPYRHSQPQPLPPDSALFKSMIGCYSALEDTESCLELYNIASSLGVKLDEESICLVLRPLCNLHIWAKVVDVVRGLHVGGAGGMSLDLLICLLKLMNEERAFTSAYATMRIWMISNALPMPPPPPPSPSNRNVSRNAQPPEENPLRDIKSAPTTLQLSERLKSEGLVDLLLMCFLIDKEANGEWVEAVEMWRWIGKMHHDGSGTPFSTSKDVRMILFELMLATGGVEGLKEAVAIMIESHRDGILDSYKLPTRGSPTASSIQLDGNCSWDIVVLLSFLLETYRLAKQGIFITSSHLAISLKDQSSVNNLSLAKGNDGRSSLVLVFGCEYRSVLRANEWTSQQMEMFPLTKPVLMLNDANSPGKVLVDVRSMYAGMGL